MAKGKVTTPEMVYKILMSYAVSQNYSETGRTLKIPTSTVAKVVKDNKDKKEFVKLCEEKKLDFAEKASAIIDKGMELLNRRLSTAIDHEDALDVLINAIFETDKEELTQNEKNQLIGQIKQLQLQKLGDITTAVGTLFDKRALARGESTENQAIQVNIKIV